MDLQRRPIQAGSLLLAALLHGLALLGLLAGLRQHPPAQTAQAQAGVLILLPPRASHAAGPPLQTSRPALAPRSAVAPAEQAAPATAAAAAITTSEPAAPARSALSAAQAASTPDPAPPTQPSLLDSEATRRAVRMATREPLLSERAAMASDDPGRLNAQQRLSQQMAQAADGDCLKGEFAGSGMGLLSLPFWLAAEARGKCRR